MDYKNDAIKKMTLDYMGRIKMGPLEGVISLNARTSFDDVNY